ncbi:IMPACT family protein [Campylobacter sp. MIT 21-1685]|uniref:IMPACT family protein n=1 Tax=unclassified Campylobacter TaxID=2593542 RepID=UPI00224B1512|nr:MULTISPECIES: YigZ family protein [unclassified Campylobacter]MCX2683827.1 IMPACT family protein [Campylobacter sp. MIT 21-1684]MCX2752111.1 IMPACT family protein [Campylobacter sp. MIT 21-1682]MCX2808304.1 IMPACT family protein [Campylobacter sp. MIT 21-1685]
MQIIKERYESKLEVKKSQFLSFLCPFEQTQALLKEVKKEHPKAVHFVYAYRFFDEAGRCVEDKSDDNEPKGTAGMPMLNVLRAYELINTSIIVVRYFGGIKLGTGGLMRAYTSAATAVINLATLYEQKNILILSMPLQFLGKMEHFLKKNSLEFKRKFQMHKVFLEINVNKKEMNEVIMFCENSFPYEIQSL